MRQANPKFFVRLKNAIFNFDEYKEFSQEKLSISIKFLLKLIILVSIIITIILTFKLLDTINKTKLFIAEQIPEFRTEDNILIIDGENKEFFIEQFNGMAIVLNSNAENVEEIQEANNYKNIIAILKDKIVIKIENGMERVITYEEINETEEIEETNLINKQNILEALSSNNILKIGLMFLVIVLFVAFIAFSLQIVVDLLLLSLIGFLLNLILGIKLKYKSIFSISVYSLTLSIVLYMIYIVVNILTGYVIIYFDLAYRAISYIYIVTALLIIKSDIIKQNMELTKIIKVQKEVRKELEEKDKEEKDEKKEDKKDEKKKNKKDNKKKENEQGQEPEGNQA